MMKVCLAGAVLAGLLVAGTAQAEAPKVVVSIAPVHSLVASVMQGVGEPLLLVRPEMSDHDYALKPSDLRKISDADLVVWIGEPLETYLTKPLQTEGVLDLELIDVAGADPHIYGEESSSDLNHRPGAGEAAHAEDEQVSGTDGEPGHDHFGLDPHIWLDPVRAQAIVAAIAEDLARLDAANADRYRQNATSAAAELRDLDKAIRARLMPLAAKPFITFHDGYSYFVERYGLNQVGQMTVNPEQRPGAATVRALRDLVAAEGVACAFAEPQFDRGIVESLAGEARIKVGSLDALGAGLEPGPSLYGALLRRNAEAVEACLSSTS